MSKFKHYLEGLHGLKKKKLHDRNNPYRKAIDDIIEDEMKDDDAFQSHMIDDMLDKIMVVVERAVQDGVDSGMKLKDYNKGGMG